MSFQSDCHAFAGSSRDPQPLWNGIPPNPVSLPVLVPHRERRIPELRRTRMSMFNKVVKTFQWGQHQVVMETGEIARQSSGAVLVNIEDTVVLATVVAGAAGTTSTM